MPSMSSFSGGVRAAVPIVLAYIPVAFALGAAASGMGLTPTESAALSGIMFSGANQALFLSSVGAGVPAALVVALCVAASLRHLLYGFVLRDRIGAGNALRAVFAYGLTDEVFAAATAASQRDGMRLCGPWLLGLSLTALASWIAGTAVGSLAGEAMRAADDNVAGALEFALPALFLGLVWSAASRAIVLPMVCAGGLAAAFVGLGLVELAIPAGGLAVLLAPNRGGA